MATHSETDVHAIARRPLAVSIFVAGVQLAEPGLPLARTSPDSSTATHSEVLGQDTPVSTLPASTIAGPRHDPAPALAAGLARTAPRSSTATHSDSEGQDTAF